jgi:hypothetical protein
MKSESPQRQMNSATSEETAAASEDLSGQTEYLKNMMARHFSGDGEQALPASRKSLPEPNAFPDRLDFGKY